MRRAARTSKEEVSAPPEPRSSHQTAAAAGDEIVIGGRRYRLVPMEKDEPQPAARSATAAELLTERELQIAALVAEGLVNKQIAEQLLISQYTVATHMRRIFSKLGVDTRAAMVSRCLNAAVPESGE